MGFPPRAFHCRDAQVRHPRPSHPRKPPVRLSFLFSTAALMTLVCGRVLTADESDKNPGARKVFDVKKRVAWTSSKIVGTPEPPSPYRTRQVFPKSSLTSPWR